MTSTPPPPALGRWASLGRDTLFVLAGFPLAVVAFVASVTGLALGLGTLVVWVGVPILAGTLFLARGLAVLERARVAPVLGHSLPEPPYRVAPPKARAVRRLTTPLLDPQRWLDLVHAIVRLVPSTVAFSVVVAWWSGAVGGLTYLLWGWSLPSGPGDQDLPELLGLGDGMPIRVVFYLVLGMVLTLTLRPVVRTCALLEAWLAQGLLSGLGELREQVVEANQARDTAQRQRAAAVSAEAVALRRLERDIHDGPQQRLVRLAMDLGRAEQQLAHDPEAARATVAEALAQTRETLAELRALSRGIAPPVLVDRGLPAALTALAGRCTVPVDLDVDLPGRLDPALESAAYFVVAEALTNVAKHSDAGQAHVGVQLVSDGLVVSVVDDGVGGAALAKGHGLAGLEDRVRSVGGVLDVVSPAGGGTRLSALLPG